MSLETKSTRNIKLFYSYAHEDEKLKNELVKQLSLLKRQGFITEWNDRDIKPGQEWSHEIDSHLNTFDVILLLISPDFIFSEYCYGIEMERALTRHEAGEATVIPIILRPVDLEQVPFAKLQFLPTDGKPITTWIDQDLAFLNVATGIRKVIKELIKNRYFNDGELFYKTSQFEDAFVMYEQVIQLDPNYAPAYDGKGKSTLRLGRLDEALTYFEQVNRLAPQNATAYSRKGNILSDLKCYEEALVAFEEAIQIDPKNVYTYYFKGVSLYKLNRNEEALTTFEQSIHLNPLLIYNHIYKGLVLDRLERLEEAISTYEDYFQLRGDPSISPFKEFLLERREVQQLLEIRIKLEIYRADVYQLSYRSQKLIFAEVRQKMFNTVDDIIKIRRENMSTKLYSFLSEKQASLSYKTVEINKNLVEKVFFAEEQDKAVQELLTITKDSLRVLSEFKIDASTFNTFYNKDSIALSLISNLTKLLSKDIEKIEKSIFDIVKVMEQRMRQQDSPLQEIQEYLEVRYYEAQQKLKTMSEEIDLLLESQFLEALQIRYGQMEK